LARTLIVGVTHSGRPSSVPCLIEEARDRLAGSYPHLIQVGFVRMGDAEQLTKLALSRPKFTVVVVGAAKVNRLVVPCAAVRKSSLSGNGSREWLGDGDFIFPSDELVELPSAKPMTETLKPIADGECCLHRYSDGVDNDEVALEGNLEIGAIVEAGLPLVALLVPDWRIDGCFDEGFSELSVRALCHLVQEI